MASHVLSDPQFDRVRSFRSFALLSAIVWVLCGHPAHADTHTWTGGELGFGSSWSATENWNPAAIPTTNDDVVIPGLRSRFDTIVAYDYTGPSVTLNNLTLNQSNTTFSFDSSVLTIAANALRANHQKLGDSTVGGSRGRGRIEQSGGTNVTSRLSLGVGATDIGAYILGGTGSLTVNFFETIGVSGIGSVAHSAGTHTVGSAAAHTLILGENGGSSGAYTLSDTGSLVMTGAEHIGYRGTGTFNQSGGTHRTTPVNSQSSITLGTFAGATGTYNLSGGSVIATGVVDVGAAGAGTFVHSGGDLSLSGGLNGPSLRIGLSEGSSGAYTLSGNASLTTTGGSIFVGSRGAGTFTQTGGTITLNPSSTGFPSSIWVASGANSTGTYDLSGGTINSGGLIIGQGGSAVFNHSGGTVNLYSTLQVDGGEYNLSGTGAFNSNAGFAYVRGTVNQTGGSLTLTGSTAASVNLGLFAGQSGTYNLDGGTLSARAMYIGGTASGPGGTGVFNLNTANSLTVSSAVTVFAGGRINGIGSTTAAVINSGTLAPGKASPGNPVGTLALGQLTLNTGSRILLDSGDLLASTANINVTGPTGVLLGGVFNDGAPIFNYGGSIAGTNNLSVGGGTAGFTYTARNDAANHRVVASAKRIGSQLQLSGVGQPAPSGGTFALSIGSGVANAAGQVGFIAAIQGVPDGSQAALFRREGDSLVTIARGKQAAPGIGGGNFNNFLNGALSMNATGHVAFQPPLVNTIDGSTAGIFRGDGNSVVPIVRDLQTIPGGAGETFAALPFGTSLHLFYYSRINDAGQVAFLSEVMNSPTGSLSGIFRGDGTTFTTIARHKQAAPGGGSFDVNFGPADSPGTPALSNGGHVAFTAGLTGSPATTGVFRGDGNSIVAIARHGQAPPGAGGGTFGPNFNLFGPPEINDAGRVAFSAFLENATDGATSGLYRGDGATTVVIARDKRAAPGGGNFSSFGAPLMNQAGQVAFGAFLAATPDSAAAGVFRSDGATLVAIARDKQTAPNTLGATYNIPGPGQMSIGPAGQVAFVAALAGTADGLNTNKALYIGDGQELLPVAISGQGVQTPGGPRVIGTNIITGTMNQFGQLPWGFFASAGVSDSPNMLFTPVLHWRAAAGGNWDAADKWTLGLAPAHVHDVLIDPVTSMTITGPATSKTVKSLTVGGGGAPATLQLGGGNVALKTSALTIDTAGGGKLDLRNGKLIVAGGIFDQINNLILSGHNAGAWNGNGILTSAATANTGLGFARAQDVALVGGIFGGLTVNAGDVLIAYTLYGDADLNGGVDFNDLARLAQNYNTSSKSWHQGDFTYDSIVDFNDLAKMAQNYNTSLAAGAIPGVAAGFEQDWATAVASVPEPAMMEVMAVIVGLVAVLGRRRYAL